MLEIIRNIAACLWLVICASLGSIYAFLNFRSINTLHPVAQIFGRICVPIFGVKLVKRGYEKLLRPGPYVIIANHQHNLDVAVYSGMVPPRTITVGKKEIVWIPFFGLIFFATGNLFIDRKNLDRAKETLQVAEKVMVENDAHIWLFPEGTRRYGVGLGEFKKGPFHLAVETGVPIQPMVCSSLKGAVELNRLSAGNIIVEVLEPIETKGRSVEEVRDLSRAAMKDAIDRLDREIAQLS